MAHPVSPWKAQCTAATLLQLKSAATTLCPPKEEKTSIGGTKGKFLKKKIGKYFFLFLMKKIQGNIWFPFRKIKFKKLCSKEISTQKIAENELFWFFGWFLAFWAQKWSKNGPKIGPNNKFELWVPKRVHRRGLIPFWRIQIFFLPIPNRFKHCALVRFCGHWAGIKDITTRQKLGILGRH